MSASSSSSSGTSPAAALTPEEILAAYFINRTKVNRQQMRYYAAGICGLICVFVLSHWMRIVFNKLSPSSKNPIRSTSRLARNMLVRKFPGFTSNGHVLVVASYLAINLAVTFSNVTFSLSGIANRCGWMVVCNFCVVVFLALKNTPLAVLTAYSYERINILHQISGYTTFVYLILHASMYADYFISEGQISVLRGDTVVAGIVAGFAFLGLWFSGAILRRWWYEAFLAVHISCFLAGLIAAAYHQPQLAENGLLIMFAVIAAIWGADRVVRGARMLVNALGNHATIEPLANGGTRITLAKAPAGAGAGMAGKHCFVWIPAVRRFESHPFTIAASSPVEFVVNSYDGFTRDLHQRALANPGEKLRVSVDGPYGTIPDPLKFDKVVLIAGGSGATFTFGLAANMLERMGAEATNEIVFIWAVKKHENLSWFADHLENLKTHTHSPKITTSLYTSESSTSNSSSSSLRPLPLSTDAEKLAVASTRSSDGDLPVTTGRPDTATLIRDAVASVPATGRVLVAACGPDGLMRTVRDVTAGLIRGDGPGVELHCEQFGW